LQTARTVRCHWSIVRRNGSLTTDDCHLVIVLALEPVSATYTYSDRSRPRGSLPTSHAVAADRSTGSLEARRTLRWLQRELNVPGPARTVAIVTAVLGQPVVLVQRGWLTARPLRHGRAIESRTSC